MDRWREEGKHAVFRFVCDKPSGEAHQDIPDWLYGKTGGDGPPTTWSTERAIPRTTTMRRLSRPTSGPSGRWASATAGTRLSALWSWEAWGTGESGMFAYDAGIRRIPETPVRERYVIPYISAFPNAKILMRRPSRRQSATASACTTTWPGEPESTREWLDWIQSGGVYNQTGEACIEPMPEVWKTAPVGGEMNSAIPMEQMLGGDLMATAKLIGDSHTTFLGPQSPSCLGRGGG